MSPLSPKLTRRGAATLAVRVHALEAALADMERERDDARGDVVVWKSTAEVLSVKVDLYRDALADIASRATEERNPDGADQAATTMQMIAREALGMPL